MIRLNHFCKTKSFLPYLQDHENKHGQMKCHHPEFDQKRITPAIATVRANLKHPTYKRADRSKLKSFLIYTRTKK